MSHSKILLLSCISCIIGIAIASFAPVGLIENDLFWFGGAVGILAVTILIFLKTKRGNRRNRTVPCSYGFFLFFLILGVWRYSINLHDNSYSQISYYNEQTITVTGKICDEIDERSTNQKITFCSEKLLLSDEKNYQEIKGKILVTANLYPSYDYGDELKIKGQLQTPEEFNDFAYDRYLSRYDIYSVIYYPQITFLQENNSIKKSIFTFKHKLRDLINYALPDPEAGLANAVILGYKKNIKDDLREKFSQVGISHIVAISGMHISILSSLVMILLAGIGLNRRTSFWLASLFLLSYIFLIGAPASAIRAGIMGFLVLAAMTLGRMNKLINSLALAGMVLLLFNPKLLRDDIGFQLSFLAVLGIAYIFPIFDFYIEKFAINRKVKIIIDMFIITIAAQVFTLPIIAINFSQVSLIAPLSNILILWMLPLLMFFLIFALALGLIFSKISFLFFLPALLFLKYIIFITEKISTLTYAFFEIDYLWWGWFSLYYVVILFFVLGFYKNKKT